MACRIVSDDSSYTLWIAEIITAMQLPCTRVVLKPSQNMAIRLKKYKYVQASLLNKVNNEKY